MQKRDLEEFRDLRGTEWGLVDSRGKTEVDFDAPVQAEMSALLAAAPKLALAALASRRLLANLPIQADARTRRAIDEQMTELESALAAAGVEVE